MAVDFLKIGDIKGESLDAKHKDEIQIESFSFGQAGDANADTGQRTGKVAMQDYSFVMPINVATPRLMTYCADGNHINSGSSLGDALITVRKAGQTQVEFLKIKFFDVMISSYQSGASQADTVPTDQFSLWFGKIELGYYRQNPDGSLAAPVYFRWDRIKGESF
jgi:type VI secretion system secreted protein Hcp